MARLNVLLLVQEDSIQNFQATNAYSVVLNAIHVSPVPPIASPVLSHNMDFIFISITINVCSTVQPASGETQPTITAMPVLLAV